VVECFFGTLKREPVHHERYADHEAARRSLFESIGAFTNRRRRHSTLGYRSPAEYELRFAPWARPSVSGACLPPFRTFPPRRAGTARRPGRRREDWLAPLALPLSVIKAQSAGGAGKGDRQAAQGFASQSPFLAPPTSRDVHPRAA
jgi:hypothetical protein